MGINYGRIIIIYHDTTDNGDLGEIYKYNAFGKESPTPHKGGIETHLSQVRREMIQLYGLISTYFVETFNNLATLNRYIRNMIFKYTEEIGKLYRKTYTANTERYWGELA